MINVLRKAGGYIQPGLWALEEMRDEVLRKIELKPGNKKSEELFTHGYYQGLLVDEGYLLRMATNAKSFLLQHQTSSITRTLTMVTMVVNILKPLSGRYFTRRIPRKAPARKNPATAEGYTSIRLAADSS